MNEESFVDFKCPHCGDGVSFPGEYVGRAEECPNCANSLIVPRDGSEVGGKLPIPIATPRLSLRRLQAGDWSDLMEILSDEELLVYLEGRVLGEEEVIKWLEAEGYVRLTSPDQTFYLGLETKEGHKLIGYASLRFTDPQRQQALLSLMLNRTFHRKGFGTEALSAVLGFCFEGIGLRRVTAQCDSRNVAACKLCEKVGLRREGEFVQDRMLNAEWVNTVWFAMLREEYPKR
jgi:[ribosomal protein S5]-alanine N-acetyltransferase